MVVSDTSPIICLIRLKRINLLNQLFGQVIIPKAVYDEVIILETFGEDLTGFINAKWLQLQDPQNSKMLNELGKLLDSGEISAIALAKELKVKYLLIDEKRGRKIASEKGLIVIGTIGILLMAKKKGLIRKIKPYLEKLKKAGFWIDKKLYKKITETVNE